MTTRFEGGAIKADGENLTGSEFRDVNLAGTRFDDVNLRDAVLTNVALTGATIRNACLAGVSIEDAGLEGMRIDGILVTELLRVYRAQTEPLVARYRAAGLLAEVDASGSMDQVEALTKAAGAGRTGGRAR